MGFLETLSAKEQKFYLSIVHIESESSLWGMAITNVLTNPDPDKFRNLIDQLKSQASDSPEVMRLIIGQKAFQQLKNL